MIAKKPDADPSDVQSISAALTQELIQPYSPIGAVTMSP
jgi:hypothetical protein